MIISCPAPFERLDRVNGIPQHDQLLSVSVKGRCTGRDPEMFMAPIRIHQHVAGLLVDWRAGINRHGRVGILYRVRKAPSYPQLKRCVPHLVVDWPSDAIVYRYPSAIRKDATASTAIMNRKPAMTMLPLLP
jgi:hypothetical protein